MPAALLPSVQVADLSVSYQERIHYISALQPVSASVTY
jgi:hypothetical protein